MVIDLGMSQSIQTGQLVSLNHLPAAARQNDFSHSCRALGFALSASFPEVAQQLSSVRQAAQAYQAHSDMEVPVCPSNMVRHELICPGASLWAVSMATGRLTGCSDPVRRTILSARALSTRQQYDNRCRFSQWCSACNENRISCPMPTILEFLQSLLDKGRSPLTLKVYLAAISCHHASVDDRTVAMTDV
ncbi:hypothetical protein XENOCAPTIV_022724 [Xenoophorus captivus]|uniref:Uncharacterized protein n=1 Tax=Xenoophorus captivus TaxID=1517983 RepID=A0ABV0RJU9_9TELE